MPPSSPTTPGQARYYLRRRGAAPSGPHDAAAIAALREAGKLDGSEEISSDGRAWKPVATILGSPGRGAPAAPTAGAGNLDLDDGDSISLPPLELGFGSPAEAGGTPVTVPSRRQEPETSHGTVDLGSDEAVDLGAPLELVTRTPATKVAPAVTAPPPSSAAAGRPASLPGGGNVAGLSGAAARLAKLTPLGSPAQVAAASPPARDPLDAGDAPAIVTGPLGSDASAAVASLLEGEADPAADATKPVRLDELLPPAEVKVRRRTMTATRGAGIKVAPVPGAAPRRRLPRRTLLIGGGALVLVGATAAAVLLDLPARLRGEPARAKVLGAVAADLEQDRFPAFSEAARLLEESVASRKRARPASSRTISSPA